MAFIKAHLVKTSETNYQMKVEVHVFKKTFKSGRCTTRTSIILQSIQDNYIIHGTYTYGTVSYLTACRLTLIVKN